MAMARSCVTIAMLRVASAAGLSRRRKRYFYGSAQEAHHVLRHLVGLGQHGRTGLLQDLGAGQFGGFLGEIGITDTAARGGQVFRRGLGSRPPR